jgi:hypothetical protein
VAVNTYTGALIDRLTWHSLEARATRRCRNQTRSGAQLVIGCRTWLYGGKDSRLLHGSLTDRPVYRILKGN